MSQQTRSQVNPLSSPSVTLAPLGLLQRKCDCGKSATLTGQCNECERKKFVSERHSTDEKNTSEAPVVHEVLRSPIPAIQPKLKIGQPNDKYEQEADRIADQIMRMPYPSIQPQVEPEVKKKLLQTKPLVQQRTTSGEGIEAPSIVHDVLRSPGKPLDPNIRTDMESRFNHDFGNVQIHTDKHAAESAQAVNALAYTVNKDIVFGRGQYRLDNFQGRSLLAHELTHVVQQKHQLNQLTDAPLMREDDFKAQQQFRCPSGSCHVHVQHYQSAFGGRDEEPKWSFRGPIPEKKLFSPEEIDALAKWLQSSQQQPQSSRKLPGQYIKSDVTKEYEKHKGEFASKPNRKVKVIMFEVPKDESDPDWPKLKASEVSAKQKEKTFKDLSLLPEIKVFPRTVGRKEFVDYIEAQNKDKGVFGIIVQLPAPAHLQGDVKRISPKKDLDSLSSGKNRKFNVPATSEGVVRVVLSFVQSGETVAVIGGKGFVGKGVVTLLQERGIAVGVFEQGDDLKQVKAYDIVVSTVGKPRVVRSEHLKPEHILVVDTGFNPETEKGGGLKVIGDVEESAQEIPQNITPVPGGTGPVEMAVLMERAAQLLGIKVKSWKVELRDGKLRAVFSE